MTTTETTTHTTQINTIARDRLRPDPDQPRELFDQDEIAELRESIREHGLLQPLLVRHEPSKRDGSPYIVVAGERRFHASEGVLDALPCIVRDATPEQAQELALVENIQRANLTPIEEARGIASLMEAHGLSQMATAKRLHKHINWVRNRLALLKIAADAQSVAAIAPDKMTALVEIDTVRDDPSLRSDLLHMAASGTSHSAIMERIDAYREKQRREAQTRRAPDEETQARNVEQERSGGGQMSRGRMVTGTPRDETRAQIEEALAELERHTKTLAAWTPKAERKYLQERVEPRLAKLRRDLMNAGRGE